MREKTEKTVFVSAQEMEQQHAYTTQLKDILSREERQMYVYIETFGCQQNEADSERLLGMACEMGYQPTQDPQQADLLLVNTCAVREHAELKALSITGQFKHLIHGAMS